MLYIGIWVSPKAISENQKLFWREKNRAEKFHKCPPEWTQAIFPFLQILEIHFPYLSFSYSTKTNQKSSRKMQMLELRIKAYLSNMEPTPALCALLRCTCKPVASKIPSCTETERWEKEAISSSFQPKRGNKSDRLIFFWSL